MAGRPHTAPVPDALAPSGFGGRTFRAEGRRIWCNPREVRKADGLTNISLGFPFAELTEASDDDAATGLAEYLSDPVRPHANELLEALVGCVKRLRRCAEFAGNAPFVVDALCEQFEAVIARVSPTGPDHEREVTRCD